MKTVCLTWQAIGSLEEILAKCLRSKNFLSFFFSSGAMHRTADTTARKLEFEESLKKEKLVMNGTRMMTDKSGKRGLLWMALWRESLQLHSCREWGESRSRWLEGWSSLCRRFINLFGEKVETVDTNDSKNSGREKCVHSLRGCCYPGTLFFYKIGKIKQDFNQRGSN